MCKIIRTNFRFLLTKVYLSAILEKEQRFVLEKVREEMFKKYRVESKTRFILFIISMILIIFGMVNFVLRPEYVSGSTEPIYETVIVKTGDTLWDIASKYVDAKTDIRMFIYDISVVNEIQNGQLIPGQEILIPMF